MSQTANLLYKIARDTGYDPALLKDAVKADDVNIVRFNDDGGVAVRTRHHVTSGGTQGGTRLLVVPDGETPDVAHAMEHSYDLAGVMTIKTGNLRAAVTRAYEKSPAKNSWFQIPETGGAKGVLMMRSSRHADPAKRDEHLREFVRGHLEQLEAGDGIGPDMGITPDMMRLMGDEAAKHLGYDFKRQFTNRGDFPGRAEATGRYAVAAMAGLAGDLPESDRTHVIQGIGSAGGHYARILDDEYYQLGHRVLAVGDKDRGLEARSKTAGLRWGKDYKVDETGTITWWNKKAAREIPPEKVLYVPGKIKVLAAIGGVITPDNCHEILGLDKPKHRAKAIVEIANMGIYPAAATVIERDTDVRIAAAPFASAGGVLASLWERHEPLLAERLGRKVAYEDVARALDSVAECNCEAVIEEAAADKIGLYEAAHRLGFKQHFMAGASTATAAVRKSGPSRRNTLVAA